MVSVVSANFGLVPVRAEDEASQAGGVIPTVNVPGFTGDLNLGHGAVFWFGKVTPSVNSTDVRIAYDNAKLTVVVHVIDRLVWYDPSANSSSDLTQFDGATLYFQTIDGQGLGSASYRLDAQAHHWEPDRTPFQRAYRYNSGGWTPASVGFTTTSGFRGSINDGQDARGYLIRFDIPFTSLGQGGAPSKGTAWRMAVAVHDRDSQNGAVNPDQIWPSGVNLAHTSSWGRIVFGVPGYQAPSITQRKTLVLKDGVNGVSAPDGEVGGHTICGEPVRNDFFGLWGEATYPHYPQINLQNQWDIADFPCFSKYYAIYPLSALPKGAKVISATLEMQMFGNAGYHQGDAKPMLVQVARVSGAWDEQTLNWNNAPTVLETYGGTIVNPVPDPNNNGPFPYQWDVSRAVADALAAGEPLSLSLYTPAGDYHTGKYFWSADAGENVRPKLTITYGVQAYDMTVQPPAHPLQSGTSIDIPVTISANAEGNPVKIDAGPSTPAGLTISVNPTQVPASGGTVIVRVADTHGAGFAEPLVYKVPIKATAGSTTLSQEVMVILNGSTLYLPSLAKR